MSYSSAFAKEFQKELQKYSHLKNIVRNKVRLLIENPYQHCKSEPLHHHLKGLRSARVTQNIRLIFAICEEAKKYARDETREICEELGGKGIVFITLGVHNEVYR